ncbi:cold-shock protein [Streptomyces mashuensis]|uniref:Cold-shock protein n=1 Tax=Streptomyces mashuensis TaxID=33904 RepID=A0A919EG15_9ACTN|nr:cold-shock protein [Streptomyces mashuensis]GHF67882.1 cold-shock protein [Streptomyces mashuensis]
MARGTVKWFDNDKGFGYIEPESGGEEVFVSHSDVKVAGFPTLSAGQTVEYESLTGPKGPQARDVKPVG